MDTVAITSSSIVYSIWHEKKTGFWSLVYNLIRLILVCVQGSLIIQKSYNTSLMIQILSCVPALMLLFFWAHYLNVLSHVDLCLIQSVKWSYIFLIFSRFWYIFYICLKFPLLLYIPKSYIFPKLWERKKVDSLILSVNFI